jgi:dethiobiotin synthetase
LTADGTHRPATLVAVLGTATEVGKTWVSCRLIERLRLAGVTVAARKPVQSFEPPDDRTDAALLAAASGESPSAVCPPHRAYPAAMAPPMAAEALDRPPFTAADLLSELTFPARCDVGLVETVGGARSPMTDDADSAGFVRGLRPDITVLVADAHLGAINAVRLAAAAIADGQLMVLLNRYEPGVDLQRRNRDWLVERDHLPIVTDLDELARAILDRCR